MGRLPGEKPRWTAPAGVVEAVRALEYVQVDPMQVLAHNHDLVLAARVEGYRHEFLEKALYGDRQLVEVVARNRYIVPVEDYPVFRLRFAQIERRSRPGLAELEPVMERVLRRIEAEGPMSSLDFDDDQRVSGWWEPDGQSRTRAVRQALEWLWHFGRLGISHRAGARRYFDLPERLLGPEAAPPSYEPKSAASRAGDRPVDGEEAGMADLLVRKYLRAMGLANLRDWSFGWARYTAAQKKDAVRELAASGDVVPVTVEGAGTTYYVLAGELGDLTAAGELRLEPDIHFLPPLDNLIWLRDRLADVFGLDYTWEAYVPEPRRRYGPYTCPILRGDGFVGRIDARADRKAQTLVVRGIWWEPQATQVAASKLHEALERWAKTMGLGAVDLEQGGIRP